MLSPSSTGCRVSLWASPTTRANPRCRRRLGSTQPPASALSRFFLSITNLTGSPSWSGTASWPRRTHMSTATETDNSAWQQRMLRHIPPGQLWRYLCVGAFNTLFGYSLFALLNYLLYRRGLPVSYIF